MKIPQTQLTAITTLYVQDYVTDVAAYLKNKYADWLPGKDETGADAFIRKGIRKAARFNLRGKKEVTAYLEYTILYGNDFEDLPEHAWAARILRIRNIQGAEKLHRLLERHPL